MRFFKSIKRKVGNAILPVVGTILGLTILAGSVVGVALNSSKIVYRQSNLEKNGDARQILYIACKYFCSEINPSEKNPNGKTASQIRDELQEIFDKGLKITQEGDVYYIYYPNVFVDSSQTIWDDSKGNEQVKEWLKAKIAKSDQNDDNGDHGHHSIGDVLLQKEAKIDEKFAVGNLMTVYLADKNEKLLPGREYEITQVSLVESDIDTFDEAFTYMNNTGVLEIDDIAVLLYKFKVLGDGSVKYIETPETINVGTETEVTYPYTIVYKTGNLGGNYYWQDNGTDYETWLYRQEYDIDLLYDLICYQNAANSAIKKSNLKYTYDETKDSHKIYSTLSSDNFELTYSSSQKFADAIADYIFWENMPMLCMHLSDFKDKIYQLVENQLLDDRFNGYSAYYASRFYSYKKVRMDYEWTNKGVRVYIYYKDYQNYNSNYVWYKTYDYMPSEIINIFETQGLTKYLTGGKIDREKLYSALTNIYTDVVKNELLNSTVYGDVVNYYKSDNNKMLELQGDSVEDYTDVPYQTEEMYTKFEVEYSDYGNNRKEKIKNQELDVSEKYDDWNKKYRNGTYSDYDYFVKNKYYNPNFYRQSQKQSFDYIVSVGNNTLTQQIIDYINQRFSDKYITQRQQLSSSTTTDKFDSFASVDADKLICKPHWIHQNNGTWEIRFYFKVIVRRNGATDNHKNYKDYTYAVDEWDSMNTGDTIYMTDDEFFENFADGICEYYVSKNNMSQSQYEEYQEMVQYIETHITTLTRDYIKGQLVDPLRYQYLPNSTFNKIIGTNSDVPGMREQNYANKLLTYYLKNGEEDLKEAIGEKDYSITINSINFVDDLSSDLADYLDLVISFDIDVKDGNTTTKISRSISFIIKFCTYNAQNVALFDSDTDTYTDVLNKNYETDVTTGKIVFSPVGIKNNKGEAISVSDIESGKVESILSAVPYTERINSNAVVYKDHKITVNGSDYTVVDTLTPVWNSTTSYYEIKITENTLYTKSITALRTVYNSTDQAYLSQTKIIISDNVSFFVNGDLFLYDNDQLVLGDKSLLFVNGNMNIKYEFYKKMSYSNRTYYVQQMNESDRNYFRTRGVNVYAGFDAKIMINGNFDYKGYQAKYCQNSQGFIIHHADGTEETTKIDTIFEQYVFSTGFKTDNQCTLTYDEETKKYEWQHCTQEYRGMLEGIYIINGDLVFHAWDELNTTDNSYSEDVAMYRNMYSNPLINATFYIDGTFDMRGLYTSGLYDKCRANFVFAKSIIEPAISLNTILCAGENSTYGAWSDTDGYLFMICEEAIDFSKVNFACVNLYTPFQELVNAINANKVSETNFSKFIEKGPFVELYPDDSIIDGWGLAEILRSGLRQLYAPGDVGSITQTDHIAEPEG